MYAKDSDSWRQWLVDNHETQQSVWLIIYHRSSPTPSVYYNEAVEMALCFGWIDGQADKRDHESSLLFFSQRKKASNWSKTNRLRIEKLTASGLMTPRGQAMVDLAKQTGTWDKLEQADPDTMPPDLKKAFAKNKTARSHFLAFAPSSRRMILEWILMAKKPETRETRITETVALAAQNKKAHHPVKKG